MKFPRVSMLALVVSLGLSLTGLFGAPRTSVAMPEFAQATGLQCSACHTMVPLLNAFGRYVQRTGYAALQREQLDKTFPLWIDESMQYDSTAGAGTGVARFDFGNLAIHAVGYALPAVTYHIQQWITQGSQSGGLDTAWIAKSNFLQPDLHLFVGKILNPAPSPYSQTSDIDGPTASGTVVGEHDWGATYNNRWGTKLAYVGQRVTVEAGYFLSSDDLNGITDFSAGDKTFQYKVALARVTSPLEVGVFGSSGTIPVSTGTDRYNSQAAYAQLDPGKYYRPGALVIYQTESDSNAGADANGNAYGNVQSHGISTEIFESLLQGNVLLSYRHDMNQAGPTGGYTNGNSLNLAFNVPIAKFPYLHGYVETNLGGSSALYGFSGGPTFKGMLWLTVPIVLHPNGN